MKTQAWVPSFPKNETSLKLPLPHANVAGFQNRGMGLQSTRRPAGETRLMAPTCQLV